MENLSIDQQAVLMDNVFLPLKDFGKYLKVNTTSPYQSNFSFSKLIEDIKLQNSKVHEGFLDEAVTRLEALIKAYEHDSQADQTQSGEEVEPLMEFLFSSLFRDGQMGFIKSPFESFKFKFQTEPFKDLLQSERWELKINPKRVRHSQTQNILLAGIAILNTFYDQKVTLFAGEKMTLRDRTTKMERHYKFDMHLSYLDVKAVKPLRILDQKQIHDLLNNLDDTDLWLEYLPPEHFVFEGFVLGYLTDVTETEILSTVKEMAANEGGKSGHQDDLAYLEILLRSLLNMPEVQLGALQAVFGPWIDNLSWNLLREYDPELIDPSLADDKSYYGQLLHQNKPIIVPDLQQASHLSPLEETLLEKGIRSLLLAPLKNADGRTISIFELASTQPYRFNQFTLNLIEEYISLFEVGTNKFLDEMDNSVRLTIQQEFTSIHPAVEWKFRQVASKYYWERVIESKQSIPDPISFRNVYPIYGQADIVGSSKIRNKSIVTDLTENLTSLLTVLKACRGNVNFHLFEVFMDKIETCLDKFKEGIFISSDESHIVDFLTREIHPILRKLKPRFAQLPHELIEAYFNQLDPELNIIYRARKDYEDSVGLINQTISNFLLEEEAVMQEVLPHFFEKFQTDGVEYNIYIGQSLLETETFHDFYLRDFRLWQLVMMCKMTRLIEKEAKNFPVPLRTAQLIFVFNSTLSICFQMDEKQFDIDGAYNVRYEIIKKRIDKAYIKGTDERLTQAGKIAIVWLQEKDRQEYQEYIDYLLKHGYITPEVEDLDLERMQGVEGLKAIRVEVAH